MSADVEIVDDETALREAADLLDWGVLVEAGQGGLSAYLCGLSYESAARCLRAAAEALDEAAADAAASTP